jgi:hypothetical protein
VIPYRIVLVWGNVIGTPARRTKLYIVVGIAGVPDIGKMEVNLAFGRDGIAFALARRSKAL